MGLGERLKLVRGNISQKDFGLFFGATANTVRAYENESSSPNTDYVLSICEKYRINPAWLFAGEGPMSKEQEVATPTPIEVQTMPQPQPCYVDENGQVAIPRWQNPDPEMFDYVPMAETQLSAGGGCFVISEAIEGYYAFRKTWISRIASSVKNLVLMRVLGNSMSPTIQEADTVMIDIGKRSIKEGMLYAIRFDATVMIKRLSFRPGGRVLIISDNRHEFEPYEAEMKDLHIIGQIIFFSRTFATD